MSQQNGTQKTPSQRPTNDDKEEWKAYWKQQGQPWRTQPEIDAKRQEYLTERRRIRPDIEQGIYPFKDTKLSRADMEWLLATHENGGGPVKWSHEAECAYEGLDLRGVDLRQMDLRYLPLSCIRGALTLDEWIEATEEQRKKAVAHLEGADFSRAQLEGANLSEAQLENADLSRTQLKGAYLSGAQLKGANLYKAQLEDTFLYEAQLEGAFLNDVILSNKQGVGPHLADVQWNNTNLAMIDWSQVTLLGDEYRAQQKTTTRGKLKDAPTRLDEYRIAARANRQLAVVLQAQGLSEEQAYFAYRAQKLQRVVLRRQGKFGQYLFSLFLDVLAGYGFKPMRSVLWYLIIIFGFTLAYFVFGHLPLFPDSLIFSLTSFHGRGFFPGLGSQSSLHNPLVVLAAAEAVMGLFIEISFIATFTQRFFGR